MTNWNRDAFAHIEEKLGKELLIKVYFKRLGGKGVGGRRHSLGEEIGNQPHERKNPLLTGKPYSRKLV